MASCSSNRTVWENTDIDRCPEESWLALILFAAYMIFTNVLLLSLLIAMFRCEISAVKFKRKVGSKIGSVSFFSSISSQLHV